MKRSTSQLLGQLKATGSIKAFIERNDSDFVAQSFSEHLLGLCKQRGISRSTVINSSGIERSYAYQLFRGLRFPSRDKVIQLAIGFQMSIDETQELLKTAQKCALYPRVQRDAVVLFGINKKLGVMQIQEMLDELGLTLLGNEAE